MTENPATHGFESHDHTGCVQDALRAAEAYCGAEGLNLTPTRRRALELLLQEHKAMGAYDILARFAEEGLGRQPPTAYRALDFLVGHGLAHKIEKLNAYIACALPGAEHAPAFLICRSCDRVVEAPAPAPLRKTAAETDFKIETMVIEAEGLCPGCRAP